MTRRCPHIKKASWISDHMVLRAYREARNQHFATGWPHELLMRWTDATQSECLKACRRARDHGFLEQQGLCVRWSHITPTGFALLEQPENTP